jgi:S1-C subfamily serine protease
VPKKLLTVLLLLACVPCLHATDPERSVVQILTYAQQPVWDAPWRFDPVQRMGGTGFVVKGKRIMTNAHVVTWGKHIIVRRYQDPHPYVAEVEFIGHDCDLALLTVEEDRFFDHLEPLEMGELPKVRSAVVTMGYPAGGEEISYTRGVVSRIELDTYSHIGNRRLLSVETDAAINPGNSGGPVVQDDRVVGVAFQGIPGLQNAGFFIPTPVINHFLKDIADSHYDGFPQAGLRMAPLQNPAYRSLLKLLDNDIGTRVDSLLPIPTTEAVLKPEDVILKVGAFPVASDDTILYDGNRVSAALAFQFAQTGEKIPLQIWRDGKPITVDLPVFVYKADYASGHQYGALPRYFVYGGLVFTPLSLDYMRAQGAKPGDPLNNELYYELYYHRQEDPAKARPEPVVMASVLPAAVNANVGLRGRGLVDKVNGVRIEKLEDLIRAFETNTNAYDLVEFLPHHNQECLGRAEAIKANSDILKMYGVAADRRL